MGRDKAMLRLGGKTLLARAVETLKSVHSLGFDGQQATVTIIGERTLLEGADRAIADRSSQCGPLGGIEAALSDLETTHRADWAFFIPVDMPFLSAAVIGALLGRWIEVASEGARVCYAIVDGTPQPLVSLVHKSLYPYVVRALAEGWYKVTPVLQSACDDLASCHAGELGSVDWILRKTVLSTESFIVTDLDRSRSATEDRARQLWFANLNTEEEFSEAETFFLTAGFTF